MQCTPSSLLRSNIYTVATCVLHIKWCVGMLLFMAQMRTAVRYCRSSLQNYHQTHNDTLLHVTLHIQCLCDYLLCIWQWVCECMGCTACVWLRWMIEVACTLPHLVSDRTCRSFLCRTADPSGCTVLHLPTCPPCLSSQAPPCPMSVSCPHRTALSLVMCHDTCQAHTSNTGKRQSLVEKLHTW